MATIQTRTTSQGQTKHRVLIRLKGYPPQSATFDRKTDAKRWAQKTEAAMREGRHFKSLEAARHTMADMIDRYLETILPGKKSARDQKRHLQWWRKALGSYLLKDVTPSLIAEQRERLAKGNRTNSTVNRYLTSMSHPFTIAQREWGWVESNPLRSVSKLKEPRGRVRYLSTNERTRLLNACKEHSNPDLYLAVVLALSTGARQSEIWGLRWPQIDFDRGLIVLTETKNNERRSVPIVDVAFGLLWEKARFRRLDTDLVFPSRKNVAIPLDMRNPFEDALKKAGIEDFRWHDLRHTTASELAMNGATLAEIAEVLGHKSLSMVKRYAHLSESHTLSVVQSMNKKMWGTS